ncbi:MAG: NUDIX domain-containing protein [Gammaproteobacteria bacterium]|jgi:ADP-ribose pyrophosphatase|tara:strand:+ start:600 stop:1250 length:651 start_codon:yes stop_codon:yes gene_type:complete
MTHKANQDSKLFDAKDVEIISRSLEHDGFLRIEHLQLRHRLFSGAWSDVFMRELQLKDPAVGVLLFDPDRDMLLLVRQFRVGMFNDTLGHGDEVLGWPLEIVAGMVARGEQFEEVALRESKEESNCVPTDLIKICEYYNSPGGSNEKIILFCGRIDSRNAGGVYGLIEEHEDIEVQVLSYADAMRLIDSGEINNAMTIIALQWLQLHRQELLDSWN